jgi:hypothetical protein
LIGEGVRVLEERGDWARVTALLQPSSLASEGYPGWVRRAHLGLPVQRTDGGTVRVTSPTAACDIVGAATVEISFGTALWAEEVSDELVQVLLPGDRRGRLRRSDLRVCDKAEQPSYAVDELLDSARQFLGLRYLWGGTSAWGLDCSGLVHLAYRAQGVVVPRDAFDQAAGENVEPVRLDDVEPGDLYFFARPGERVYHVGFATRRVDDGDVRWMLHAPEGGERIEDAPMAPHRIATLVSAGRVI